MGRRGLGSPALFAVIYTVLAGAIYFSLGVVASHALAVTPLVYLAAGVFFVLAAFTYVEGSSLHQDRGGSTVLARYAFNELVSFIAGWATLLDYIILIAVTAFTATNYLAAFWGPLGRGTVEILASLAIISYVAVRNVRGFSKTRVHRVSALVVADLGLQVILIVLGLIQFFHWSLLTKPIHLGSAPTWGGIVFALGAASVVVTGLESASGLAGEVGIGRQGLKRVISSATLTVMVVYVGVATVALTALPQVGDHTALAQDHLEAPMLGIAMAFPHHWEADTLKYAIAAAGSATLIAAANSAMLGLSRLAYSLSTNRQIPSALGRLHPKRATPIVVIGLASAIAGALTIPRDLDYLVGIYAFGTLLALTLAHLSVCVLRYKEPDAERPYRIPFNIRVRGGSLPVPAALGAVLAALGWVSIVVTHKGARYVGFGWMLFGVALYLVYRLSQDKPVFARVVVPEAALRREGHDSRAEYGSILVPLFGTPLDDDIIQTAGRLAADEHDDFDSEAGSIIEALWVFEVPMSLPIDARLPDEQLERARTALRRAKAVGEEYEGVEVATATVRARRAGAAIVDEARRRGVEAVVLAAEEPSRIRSGPRLGGRGVRLDTFVGDVTKYVIAKAPCQVILTAPPATPRTDALPKVTPDADAAAAQPTA